MPTVDELIVKLKAENRDLKNKLNKSKGDIDDFGNSVLKAGGILAGLFAIKEAGEFALEVSKIAGAAEGVEDAFNELDGITLSGLRKAVDGTVDDITLMQSAVKAENFKIPLEKLGKFFEFATKRATQTGESVNYLVESIINGIGRKSSLVLDNLGISASELQEEIKKVGDFGVAAGNIIEREMGKMGNVAETTGAKYDRVTASWTNFTLALGNFINQSPLVADSLELINKSLKTLADYIDPMGAQWREVREEAEQSIKEIMKLPDSDVENYIELLRSRMKEATAEMGRYRKQVREAGDATFKAWAGDKAIEAQKQANLYYAIIQGLEKALEEKNKRQEKSLALTEEEAKALEKLTEQYAILFAIQMDLHDQNLNQEFENKPLFEKLGFGKDTDLTGQVSAMMDELEPPDEVVAEWAGWRAKLREIFDGTEDDLRKFNESMEAMVRAFAAQIVTEFAVAMGEFIGEGRANPKDFGKKFLQIFAQFLQTVGSLMIAFGTAGIAFEAAKDSGQYYAAIYAGIALTVAGAAVVAAIKKGPNYSSGGGGDGTSTASSSNPNWGFHRRKQPTIKVEGEIRTEGTQIIVGIRNSQDVNDRAGVNYGYGGG